MARMRVARDRPLLPRRTSVTVVIAGLGFLALACLLLAVTSGLLIILAGMLVVWAVGALGLGATELLDHYLAARTRPR